jgi:excisionase family DNA binding protein
MKKSIVRRFVSYPEARDYSGLSVMTLRRLVAEAKLKAYKPTGERKVLLDIHQLDALILESVEGGAKNG